MIAVINDGLAELRQQLDDDITTAMHEAQSGEGFIALGHYESTLGDDFVADALRRCEGPYAVQHNHHPDDGHYVLINRR